MEEIWKDINGFEGYYQVSNLGNVRSVTRKVINNNRGGMRVIKGKILKAPVLSNGYKMLNLCKNGKQNLVTVHSLVAKMFICNTENKTEINHIDGVKTNNCLSNLEWVSRSENIIHSYNFLNRKKTWLGVRGGKHPISKKIYDTSKNIYYETLTDAAKAYNLKRTTLIAMLKNQNPNKTPLRYAPKRFL